MTETHTTFPNKFEAFYLVAVLIAIEILISLAVRESSLLSNLDWQGASGFITVVANGLVFIFLLSYKQLSYRSLFHSTSHSIAKTVGVLLLPVFLIVPGLILLTGVLNSLVEWLFPMSLDDREMFAHMVATSVIPLFFACVAAPLLEEMLFRGVIVRSFLQQYSRTQSILWSSLLFALAHLNVYQFFTALVLGVVLGWLYERTRSLWPSICLHTVFNGSVAFSASATMSALNYSFTWIFAIAIVGAIVGGAWLLRTLEPTAAQKRPNDLKR
jgi:membrane protease YdiL (CAAX protease family)